MISYLKVMLAVLFVCASCNCGSSLANTTLDAASSDPASAATKQFESESSTQQSRRGRNKRLMDFITARTVAVHRDCTVKDGHTIIGTSNPNRFQDGSGTGIIVRSTDGGSYIFTAAHVIEPRKNYKAAYDCVITIRINDDLHNKDNAVTAKVLSSNRKRDIAVLGVDKNLGVSTELEIDPFTGEDIWAAGYPVQLASPGTQRLSITKGTLATRDVPAGKSKKAGQYHRVTSQVYFGNSGGGIWNKEGKLVGIVVTLYAGERKVPYEGYYYVKPVKEVIRLLVVNGKEKMVLGI